MSVKTFANAVNKQFPSLYKPDEYPTVFVNDNGTFISAEGSTDVPVAEYYEPRWGMFGIRQEIYDLAGKHGVFLEWVNPGCIGCYPK